MSIKIEKETGIFKEPKISECRLIYLPKVDDVRGNLTFIEENQHIPFTIKWFTIFTMFREVKVGEGTPTKSCNNSSLPLMEVSM